MERLWKTGHSEDVSSPQIDLFNATPFRDIFSGYRKDYSKMYMVRQRN